MVQADIFERFPWADTLGRMALSWAAESRLPGTDGPTGVPSARKRGTVCVRWGEAEWLGLCP